MDTLLGGEVPGPDSGDVNGDGQLDVGEIWIYTGTYTITQEDIDAGEVNNTATVDATCPAGSTSQDNDQVTTPLCQNPDIAIVKTGVFNDGDQDGDGFMASAAIASTGRIDVLFHAAGVQFQQTSAVDTSDEAWARFIDTNLSGTFYACRSVMPEMRKQGSGAVILMASGRAVIGSANTTAYAASKGGVVSFAKSLAMKYRQAPPIRAIMLLLGL